jgi:hypothetical protein
MRREFRHLGNWTVKPQPTPENSEKVPDGRAAAATSFGVGAASALERMKKLENEVRTTSPADPLEAGAEKPA